MFNEVHAMTSTFCEILISIRLSRKRVKILFRGYLYSNQSNFLVSDEERFHFVICDWKLVGGGSGRASNPPIRTHMVFFAEEKVFSSSGCTRCLTKYYIFGWLKAFLADSMPTYSVIYDCGAAGKGNIASRPSSSYRRQNCRGGSIYFEA